MTAPPDSRSPLVFVTTGGTIDKVYFDAASQYEIGDSVVQQVLADALVDIEFEVLALMRKDSLEMTDEDRRVIRQEIVNHPASRFVVTHGTDTMSDTANALLPVSDKTVVFTGALTPARFRTTDAVFNIGMAVAAAQTLMPGVYLAMSGKVFDAGTVVKNRERNRFELLATTDRS
ncbi:MAG: asparaginase domain-containing protein [Pseudomonadota bacterium]